MKLRDHLQAHVLHAQRIKHVVLVCMVVSAVLVTFGLEHLALVLHWAANLVWIYET